MNLKVVLFTAAIASSLRLHAQTLNRFQIGTNTGTANANSWPTNERPTFATDLIAGSKYRNFGELNTGYIFTYTSPGTANGVILATADDAPERDPTSFSLYGSNTVVASFTAGTNFNLSDFVLIVNTQTLSLSTVRLTATTAAFSNSTAYSTYLLVFPTVRDAAAANSMQIGDARLTAAGTPIPTAGGTIGGGQLVPEPSGLLLLGVAGLGLVSARRRPGHQ